MRTFVAVELSSSLRKQLTDLQQRLAQALGQANVGAVVRWTPAENVHLTLRFLGEASEDQRGKLAEGLAVIVANHMKFDLALVGIGCFPNFRRPGVVWAGVIGQLELLNALQRPVEKLAQAVGFSAEERPFSPHLTIGRIRRDASSAALAAVGHALKTLSGDPELARWSVPLAVTTVALIQSDLRPAGPIYTPLARFDLPGP